MDAVNVSPDSMPQASLVTQLIRLGDDHLILGHRLSEWCGHAPMLEEDLAMPNIALDLLGQARALYTHAGNLENNGRDEDAIAYNRLENEYTNLLMCERPNGDFAHTMLRQLFFSSYMSPYWQAATKSVDETVAAIASKAVKESNYHIRHTAEWIIRLGDGTDESARRSLEALHQLTPYIKELFETDSISSTCSDGGLLPCPSSIEPFWNTEISEILKQAKLPMPEYQRGQSGGRNGRHTESMGYLLTELQFIQRSYPNMQW